METQTLYAVLIGINGYAKSALEGCINDVLAISDYFQKLCAAQAEEKGNPIEWKPLYLLAPIDEEEAKKLQQLSISYLPPTRQNIIDAFQHFKAASAQAGDYCLLYYSGHGSYVEAPDVFADISPMQVVQTFVCLDSREAGQRDLIDKEMGFLIADALDGKASFQRQEGDPPGVHFLSIMDCCFAGSNTRSDEEDIVARMEETGAAIAGTEDILGFTTKGNSFYKPFEAGQKRVKVGGLRHGRYVNLSASRDSEKSHEKTVEVIQEGQKAFRKKHGIFTYSLLQALEQGGTRISYRELMRRVTMEVRRKIDNQIPILGLSQFEDDNQLFLRNEFTTPKQEFDIACRQRDGMDEWYLAAGHIQGIVPPSEKKATSVKLNDGSERIVDVKEVLATESILDSALFEEKDKNNPLLRAGIHDMPFPTVAISIDASMEKKMQQTLSQAWDTEKLHYIRWAKKKEVPEYLIRPIANADGSRSFVLTRPGSEIPLFIRHQRASNFLGDVDKVGKWESVLRLSNPDTGIPRSDIQVEAQTLEGTAFGLTTLNRIEERQFKKLPINPEAIEVAYKNAGGKPRQPAIKLKIGLDSNESYWVGALYLDSQFGITHEYLPVQQLGDASSLYEARLGFQFQGRDFDAIPISMNKKYHQFGITNITDYLILYVSQKSFDLSQYKQDAIPLDDTRGVNFEDFGDTESDEWFTIKIPIHIHRPIGAARLAAGNSIRLGGLAIQAPDGFTATLQWANRATAQRRFEELHANGADINPLFFLPPAHLWAGSEGSEAVFFRSPASRPDHHISILELTEIEGGLNATQPLHIIPGAPLAEDEAILPFGYFPEKKSYAPLGHINEEGSIVITRLPPHTAGSIGGQEAKSIKIFFHKVIGQPPKGQLSEFNLRRRR